MHLSQPVFLYNISLALLVRSVFVLLNFDARSHVFESKIKYRVFCVLIKHWINRILRLLSIYRATQCIQWYIAFHVSFKLTHVELQFSTSYYSDIVSLFLSLYLSLSLYFSFAGQLQFPQFSNHHNKRIKWYIHISTCHFANILGYWFKCRKLLVQGHIYLPGYVPSGRWGGGRGRSVKLITS